MESLTEGEACEDREEGEGLRKSAGTSLCRQAGLHPLAAAGWGPDGWVEERRSGADAKATRHWRHSAGRHGSPEDAGGCGICSSCWNVSLAVSVHIKSPQTALEATSGQSVLWLLVYPPSSYLLVFNELNFNCHFRKANLLAFFLPTFFTFLCCLQALENTDFLYVKLNKRTVVAFLMHHELR